MAHIDTEYLESIVNKYKDFNHDHLNADCELILNRLAEGAKYGDRSLIVYKAEYVSLNEFLHLTVHVEYVRRFFNIRNIKFESRLRQVTAYESTTDYHISF